MKLQSPRVLFGMNVIVRLANRNFLGITLNVLAIVVIGMNSACAPTSQLRSGYHESKPRGESFEAMVIGVHDGDTVTVLRGREQVKIRLYGIDCPEVAQDFGTRARQATSALVFSKIVTVTPLSSDKHGRMIGKVENPDHIDVSQSVVGQGLCWWYEEYAPHDEPLRSLQGKARAQHRGVWSRGDSIPPWEFRRGGLKLKDKDVRAGATGSEMVLYNTKSLKYHSLTCAAALHCSRGCVVMLKSDAIERGGSACRVCGGR